MAESGKCREQRKQPGTIDPRPAPPGPGPPAATAGTATAATGPVVVREEALQAPRLAAPATISRPLGYAGGHGAPDFGPVGTNSNFLPVPDRWRIGLPD